MTRKHPGFCSFALAASMAAAGFSLSVQAQTPDESYEPLGIRTGSFLLFPKAELKEQYNDNVFATETNTRDDFITTLSPGLKLNSDWNNHALNFFARSDIGRYSSNDDENFEDFFLGADGRVDITRDTQVTAGAQANWLHEERTSQDNVTGVEPTDYTKRAFNLGASHRFNRVSVKLNGNVDTYDFEDVRTATATINNDDRDRDEYVISGRVGYEIVPNYEAFFLASHNIREYDTARDDTGFNRDSDGYSFNAGLAFDINRIFDGDAYVGYVTQDYDDSRLKNVDGIAFGGGINWRPTQLTTVRFSVARSVMETTSSTAGGILASSGGITVTHELLRNVQLGANFKYTDYDYQGGTATRNDDVMEFGVNGKYLFTRNYYVGLGYSYRERESNLVGADYTENVASLTLGAQF